MLGGGGAVVPAFNPLTDVTSGTLKFWVESDGVLYQDAAKTTLATANNAPVGAWVDQVGTPHDMTQATAGLRPILKTNLVGTMPGILFDGADDILTTAAFASGVGIEGYTLFVSMMEGTGGADKGIIQRGAYDPVFVPKSSTAYNVKFYAGGNSEYDSILDSSPHVLTFCRPGTAAISMAVTLRVDGTADAQTPFDNSDWTSAVLDTSNWDGYIFGIGLFAGALSAGDIASVENYLKKKLQLV